MKTNLAVVAEHYADALLQLATDARVDKTILDDLQEVTVVLRRTPEFEIVLKHPSVSPTEKKQMVISIFGGKIHDLTLRLLELLADKRRLDLIAHILKEYENLWRRRQNIIAGTLYFADKPEPHILSQMKAKLQSKLGKQLQLEEQEDRTLIGGYLLKLGDTVIDGSLKGRLQSIEQQLLSV